MLTKQITFLTTIFLLTLSLLACRGLAAPTQTGSSDAAAPVIEVVTFTEEPTITPVTVTEMPAALPGQEAAATTTSIASSSVSTEPISLTTEPVAVPGQDMNVRAGPGTDYPIIGSTTAGESFNIIGRNEETTWIQVSSEAITQGWLYADLVEMSGDMQAVPLVETDSLPRPPAAETEGQPTVFTTETLGGTIYFAVDEAPEGLGYVDPATSGSVEISLEGVQPAGIYRISPDGTNLTQINSMVPDGGIDLSPTGQKVAFHARKDLVGGSLGTYSDHDTYVMNIDGTGLTNLTDSPDLTESGVRWLPDGQRLIYMQSSHDLEHWPPREDNVSDIYILDINQATALNLTQLPPGRRVEYGSYAVSPDGQQLVFVSGPSHDGSAPPPGMDFVQDVPETLSVVNLDGSGRIDLIDMPPGYELGQLSWSPDSQRLALVVGVQQEDGGFRHDVHLISPDGSQHANITNTPDAFESNPVWSPNGQQLVVSCNYDLGGVYSKGEMTGLQFFGRDGASQTACIDLPDAYAASELKWSPDGQRVAILGSSHFVDGKLLSSPHRTLFTIKADGTGLVQITDSGLDMGWSLVAWSPGGQWLVYSATSRISITNMFTSAEEARAMIEYKIYVSRADGSQITPITAGNFGTIQRFVWLP